MSDAAVVAPLLLSAYLPIVVVLPLLLLSVLLPIALVLPLLLLGVLLVLFRFGSLVLTLLLLGMVLFFALLLVLCVSRSSDSEKQRQNGCAGDSNRVHMCYLCACACSSASFQSSRSQGCRWLRRTREVQLSDSAGVRRSYRLKPLAACCRSLWPKPNL